VIVRNTSNQLTDTTLSSWNYWFKHGQAGTWEETKKKFTLRFGDVECEVLFRPLDRPEDVARVLSLEVTFAIIDEFVEIPRAIIDALSARVAAATRRRSWAGATNWGMWGSSNPSTEDNWWFDYLHDREFHVQPDEYGKDLFTRIMGDGRNARYFLQPSGFSPNAENVENLPGGAAYYDNQAKGIRARLGLTSSSEPCGVFPLPESRLCPPSAVGCICPRSGCSTILICRLLEGLIPG
jgi:hypothetical protein